MQTEYINTAAIRFERERKGAYKRYSTRKLTLADGEHILWHVLEHLYTQAETESAKLVRDILYNQFI